jgi:N-acetylglutamate synthase-like GNAT family acetyltransferase
MSIVIRPATNDELPALGDLCMRSKAVWGYDDKFMQACRDELSFKLPDLQLTVIAVAVECGDVIGVVQVKVSDGQADLLKLFVEPGKLRSGIGTLLLAWATSVARDMGASRLFIDADPDAAPFYRRMGAIDVGVAPSSSIPGRTLPKLAVDLRTGA